jgi:hypothetical protein
MRAAILDACVLYPASLRDFFMRVAVVLYQPKWTEEIHEEWMRNVLKDRPDLERAQLSRTRELMNLHGGDCLVSGHEAVIDSVTLPDADDRHVVAAAIASKTSTIVTFNLSDFPARALGPRGIRAIHPDDFAVELYEADHGQFVALVKQHRAALKNPAKDASTYLATLDQCGLKKTVALLRDHIYEI